jgi:hypothetical protein
MGIWRPATFEEVEALLVDSEQGLHPAHKVQFQKMKTPFRKVPVASHPGETVIAVAKYEDKVIYWSDVEEGWELDSLTENGGIWERGSNQYELSHIMCQIFGDPEK